MEIELPRTTEHDLPFVISAEGDDDSCRFIFVIKGKTIFGRRRSSAMRSGHQSARRLRLDVKGHGARAQAAHEMKWFRYEGALRGRMKGPEDFESPIVMSALERERRAP